MKFEDLFGQEWETDNESDSTVAASTESLQPPDPALEYWELLDTGFNKIIKESDFVSDNNFDFEEVIDK